MLIKKNTFLTTGQLISKGNFGVFNSSEKQTVNPNLFLTVAEIFCSSFGRSEKKVLSKLTDLSLPST